MQSIISSLALAILLVTTQTVSVADILDRYVKALGSEAAIRRLESRITEGQFDNGRGLRTSFRILEVFPNKRAVLIGPAAIESDAGSGRAFNGSSGWDKNFVGTGLRTLDGHELTDFAREADPLRVLTLFQECTATHLQPGGGEDIVTCERMGRPRVHYVFQRSDGLLIRQETDGDGRASVTVRFENYRRVDGVLVPFRTQYVLPNATITYTANSIRHNLPVDARVFERPASN